VNTRQVGRSIAASMVFAGACAIPGSARSSWPHERTAWEFERPAALTDYSDRSAMTGSTLSARRAGK